MKKKLLMILMSYSCFIQGAFIINASDISTYGMVTKKVTVEYCVRYEYMLPDTYEYTEKWNTGLSDDYEIVLTGTLDKTGQEYFNGSRRCSKYSGTIVGTGI